MRKKMTPKIFIIHASEDKQRFVLDFGTKLRANGIDAWLDKWEMYPGDSLIDKIFEEGIKNAQAIIVVLSQFSVNKPWVREELNASMVKKINEGSKLIPVVIDECEVPECLKSTLWERIGDLSHYEMNLERITMSIFGHKEKPPLGKPPVYTQTLIDNFQELTKIDSIIFKLSCEKALDNNDFRISTVKLLEHIKSLEIPQVEFYESLEILDSRGYINATRVINGNIPLFSISVFGFDKYARLYLQDYTSIINSVATQIINEGKKDSKSIADTLKKPNIIIIHILKMLEQNSLIKIIETVGGRYVIITYVSPELKRRLQNN
jgi:hypothetical protein